MKIKITDWYRTTEIEADARELRESDTLAQNFAKMLSRCFKSSEPIDEDEIDDGDEDVEENSDG